MKITEPTSGIMLSFLYTDKETMFRNNKQNRIINRITS